MSRQIVLDTETTGLDPQHGHRIIEIGCVELINRKLTGRHFHQYINPQREIDEGAFAVHGISTAFLADKPIFAKIHKEFLDFVDGAELVIHNAPFDVGFINHEFIQLKQDLGPIETYCSVLDTLAMARYKHPGQKNNLDALCKRYAVDNSKRDLHGALMDAQILAEVYLAMTGGQTTLSLSADESNADGSHAEVIVRLEAQRQPLRIIRASTSELEAHAAKLQSIDKASGGGCIWKRLESAE